MRCLHDQCNAPESTTVSRHESASMASKRQSYRFSGQAGSPEQAGGLPEPWVAARAAASEGTLGVRRCAKLFRLRREPRMPCASKQVGGCWRPDDAITSAPCTIS